VTETPHSPPDASPEGPEPTRHLPVQYAAAPAPYVPPSGQFAPGQFAPPPGPYQPPVGGFHQQPQSLPPQALPASPVLVTVGDISVEQYRIVTPAGVLPTQGTNWSAMDMSRTEEKIPAWAIILAIVFALACLLGLLFLLCKERKTTGFVQITVQNGTRTHNTHVGVSSPRGVGDTLARVNFARTLCV
jgi:peptidoglycan/LPS O-acetylase OafA/YrhL